MHNRDCTDPAGVAITAQEIESVYGVKGTYNFYGFAKATVDPNEIGGDSLNKPNFTLIERARFYNTNFVRHPFSTLPGNSGAGISTKPSEISLIHIRSASKSYPWNVATIIDQTVTDHLQ